MVRVRKNFYKLSFGSHVGVLVDEKLMKKIAKLQFETKEKLLDLLENNEEHMIENYSWSISEEPVEFSQNDRMFDYVNNGTYITRLDKRIGEMFCVRKVDHLYDVSNLEWPASREVAMQEHTNYLNKEESNG